MNLREGLRRLSHDIKDFLTEDDIVKDKEIGSPSDSTSRGTTDGSGLAREDDGSERDDARARGVPRRPPTLPG